MIDDGSVAELGLFNHMGDEWLVVVTETGAGNHPAHSNVHYTHRKLGPFELQILVGVAGSRKEEVRIGDVVASTFVYMPYGGKYGPEGFSLRLRQFESDQDLVGLARAVLREPVWHQRIRPPLGGSLPSFASYPVDFPPNGFVAPICSIESILNDRKNELEAIIALGYGDSHVVEMEGYGAVFAASREHTRTIVVRGVSDPTQGKTPTADKQNQPIAAAHASAFAFELLSNWSASRSLNKHAPPLTVPPADASNDSALGNSGSAEVSAASEGSNGERDIGRENVPATAKPTTVLNLRIELSPDQGAELKRIEEVLREIAGTEEIEIIEARTGSLRLFVSDPSGALQRLGFDKLRNELAARLGAELQGVTSAEEFGDLEALRGSLSKASADLLAWPRSLPGGEVIERSELSSLVNRIENNRYSTTALLGEPGAGKSALLSTLAQRYAEDGWPVLAIKADMVDADIASEADLAERIGLSERPGESLRRLAEFSPVLLIIDQLDALASYLDLRTARLSILLGMVRRLGELENVHIVLSARTFEFNHDVRLKAVSAESLTLELPAWSEVLGVLEANGVQAAGWPIDAQEVMRVPQALATYLGLDESKRSEHFPGYQAMLERLWQERVLSGKGGSERARLATSIAETMAGEESLWLPLARYEDHEPDLKRLESAGILRRMNNSVGFAHQTLFEFSLSRSFARQPGSLPKFVLARQESLFLRPKLWAGLTYLREADRNAYHRDLEALWNTPDLRRHLRLLLVEFLGSQADPDDREALRVADALKTPQLEQVAFRAMIGSRGWFTRFGDSFIAHAMSREETRETIVVLLRLLIDRMPDEILSAIRSRWLPDAKFDGSVWQVLQGAGTWSVDMLDVARTIMARTDFAPSDVDYVAGSIGTSQPEAALRLIRFSLERDLTSAKARSAELAAIPAPTFASLDEEMVWRFTNSPDRPIGQLLEGGQEWDSLLALAETAHGEYLAILWTWYVNVFEAMMPGASEPIEGFAYPLPHDADFRFEEEQNLDLPERPLLGALRIAVEQFATKDSPGFATWATSQADLELGPVHRVITHGFASAAEALSHEGLDYLLGDQRRFQLGSGLAERSTTKRAVERLAPHWSSAEIDAFEDAVGRYNPPLPPHLDNPNGRKFWRDEIRRTRLDLLRLLPAHKASAKARKSVVEEERRFGRRARGVSFTGPQWIGPTMDSAAMAKAKDDDILNAFRTLPDATGWDHPTRWMKGGNIQLAREFATFAKDRPERAIGLIRQFTPEIGTRATGYALDAMSENLDAETVTELLLELVGRGFDGEEFRGSVSRAIERLTQRKIRIGDEVVELAESWLAAPPPSDDEEEEPAAGPANDQADSTEDGADGDEDDTLNRSLIWGYGGFASVPGGEYSVVEALVRALRSRDQPDRIVAALTSYLERQRDPRIWSSLAHFLPWLSDADSIARETFLTELFKSVPALIGDKIVAQYLARVQWAEPDWVDDQLDEWKRSPKFAAQQAYGEIVAIVAIARPEIDWAQRRLEEIRAATDMDDARVGVALSCAHMFVESEHPGAAIDILVALIPNGPPRLWDAVFEIFRLTQSLVPDDPTVKLLTAIADHMSAAPRISTYFIVEQISTLLPHEALLVGRVAQGLVDKWKSQLGDIRSPIGMASSSLVDLAITLHRLGPETREVGTTLFEHLIEIDTYDARRALDEIDSRFRDRAAVPRRHRLRRRAQERKRRAPPATAEQSD